MEDYSKLSIEDIDILIEKGFCSEQDLVSYYGNEWWRDVPGE